MGVKITGLDKLQRKLRDNATLDDVKTIVKTNGVRLTQQMKRQTTLAYVKGYSTGDTASSINLEITPDGMTAMVGPTMDYDPYVEYGTRYMAPEPIAQPSLDVVGPKFVKDLGRIMKK